MLEYKNNPLSEYQRCEGEKELRAETENTPVVGNGTRSFNYTEAILTFYNPEN